MNKHQEKIYKLAKNMYRLQNINSPNSIGNFNYYYKTIKKIYGNKNTSEKELDQVLEWSYKILNSIKKG